MSITEIRQLNHAAAELEAIFDDRPFSRWHPNLAYWAQWAIYRSEMI